MFGISLQIQPALIIIKEFGFLTLFWANYLKAQLEQTMLSINMDKSLNKESAKLLKVDELKSALKARRCSITGKKADLYDRLAAYFDNESAAQQVTEDEKIQVASSIAPMTDSDDTSKSEEKLTDGGDAIAKKPFQIIGITNY